MQSSDREVMRCLLEGLSWLSSSSAASTIGVTGHSGISRARTRLGWETMRQLHDELVKPVAAAETKGAWNRQWRLVSLDGSTLDVADEKGNNEAFGRPGSDRGQSAYPCIRFVSLVENGTHVLFGRQMAGYGTSEIELAEKVLPCLKKGMLCLADRGFFGYAMWKRAPAIGAQLLWRVRKNIVLRCEKRLPDGSYLSHIYGSVEDRRKKTNGIAVCVIAYRLDGVEGAEPLYRLITSILDREVAPAEELAALYHQRWEIDRLWRTQDSLARRAHRTPQQDAAPDAARVLRFADGSLRRPGLMHHAALNANEDPDRLSFLHAVRVVRRKMAAYNAIPLRARKRLHVEVLAELLNELARSSRSRRNPRGVTCKMNNFPIRHGYQRSPRIDIASTVQIIK